eukprot:scaffold3224_cov158-Amphora_coffeaeformis.AAC.20
MMPSESTDEKGEKESSSALSTKDMNDDGAPQPPGKNLSALAQQLRVMQAKNQTLTVEIGRLERQLRIVTELSGVSVADLRGTLERACESEAYGELQHRLMSLQAQLEQAKLKHRKADEFDRDAEEQKTANLQLRIGELEEAEGALRQELGQLYKSQDEQAEEATKLKQANDQQAKEINNLKEQLQKLEAKESDTPAITRKAPTKKLKDPPAHRAPPNKPANKKASAVPLKALPNSAKATKMTVELISMKDHSITEEAPPVSTTAVSPDAIATVTPKTTPVENMESKHIQLLRKQVESREKELKLKESQYKTRFNLQEERIVDMEQQLSSMYTAFELLDQEHSQEKKTRQELTQALRMADSQVARAVDHLQRNTTSPAAATKPAAVSPAQGDGRVLLEAKSMSSSYSTPANVSRSSSSTPKQIGTLSESKDEVIVTGYVMKRGRLNRWKKLYATLSRRFANFQLRLSESPQQGGSRKKHSFYFLTVFRSTFEATRDFPNYPYCFRIKIDKHDRNAPDIVLAIGTEKEFNEWLVGLHEAVNGANAPAPVAANMSPLQSAPVVLPATPPVATTPERAEEAQRFVPGLCRSTEEEDLAMALAESLREAEEQTKIPPEAQESASSVQTPLRPSHTLEESKREMGDASNRSEAELEAALAESLRSAQTPQTFEESKEEIGEASNMSEAELEAALAESLRISKEVHGV